MLVLVIGDGRAEFEEAYSPTGEEVGGLDVDGPQGVGLAVKRVGGLCYLEGKGVLEGGEPGFEGWETQDPVSSQACWMGDGNAGRGVWECEF